MTRTKSELAELLGVSRSSLYYRPKKPGKDEKLRLKIESVMRANPGYGHRRVALALGINHKKASRVMKKYRLKPARRAKMPRFCSEVQSCNYPNVTTLLSPVAPNLIWIADFTYIEFQGRFIYLATVLDSYTREVLGFAVKTNHNTALIMEAFDMALANTQVVPTWFHNDKGSEYRSDKFDNLLSTIGIKISISPHPWYNGKQESFFGRFKTEFGETDRFKNLPELIEAICLAIYYYNNSRIHTSLKMTPVEFKLKFKNRAFPLGGKDDSLSANCVMRTLV